MVVIRSGITMLCSMLLCAHTTAIADTDDATPAAAAATDGAIVVVVVVAAGEADHLGRSFWKHAVNVLRHSNQISSYYVEIEGKYCVVSSDTRSVRG